MGLQDFWFGLIAALWGAYLVLEGFDFGVGMLLPFLAKDEDDRASMLRTIGPVWDGNEVWLVIAGGATFAAFPTWYATMFSGFYLALLLLLVLLIVRVVSFEWRGRRDGSRWRATWMRVNAAASAGIALVWGIALANLLYGVPLAASGGGYTGSFWDIFNLYTLLAGVSFVLLFAFHGACFLGLRTTGELHDRAVAAARRLALPAVPIGAIFLVSTVVVAVQHNDKSAVAPAIPAAIGVVALILAAVMASQHRDGRAFVLTAIGTLSMVATLFTGLYPRVMVSDPNFANSLTVTNSSSAHYTLAVMTVVALIITPVILIYQGWTYHVFRGRVSGRPADTVHVNPTDR